jgi:hypothetical protein
MNFYVIESQKLVVGWSPKCACTAVCDWVVNGIIKPARLDKKQRVYLRENHFLRSPKEATAFILDRGFKSVFFVRNPATRLASGFIDKFVCRTGQPLRYPDNVEKFAINTVIDLYHSQNYSGDYKGLSFVDLITYIDFCLKEKRYLDSHWKPQVSGLSLRLKKHIVLGQCFVVKQESFQHDLKNVNYALGISYLPSAMNVTQFPTAWDVLPENADYSAVSDKLIVENKASILKQHLLTNQTKSAIARIYRQDFKLFSY